MKTLIMDLPKFCTLVYACAYACVCGSDLAKNFIFFLNKNMYKNISAASSFAFARACVCAYALACICA